MAHTYRKCSDLLQKNRSLPHVECVEQAMLGSVWALVDGELSVEKNILIASIRIPVRY